MNQPSSRARAPRPPRVILKVDPRKPNTKGGGKGGVGRPENNIHYDPHAPTSFLLFISPFLS